MSIWLLSFSAFSSITIAGENGIGQLKKDAFTLEDIHNIAKSEVSAEQALSNVASPLKLVLLFFSTRDEFSS